jgi:hypothetical protein
MNRQYSATHWSPGHDEHFYNAVLAGKWGKFQLNGCWKPRQAFMHGKQP